MLWEGFKVCGCFCEVAGGRTTGRSMKGFFGGGEGGGAVEGVFECGGEGATRGLVGGADGDDEAFRG